MAFEVAMDYSPSIRKSDGVANTDKGVEQGDELQGPAIRLRVIVAHGFGQRSPAHKTHRVERQFFRGRRLRRTIRAYSWADHFVNGNDAGMLQPARDLRFAQK